MLYENSGCKSHVPVWFTPTGEHDGTVGATRANYDDFCKYVMGYVKLLGLTDWHITFRWEHNDDAAAACVYYDYESRGAAFIMGRDINKFFGDHPVMMRKLALHEVLHLAFAEFDYVTKADNLTPTQKNSLLGVVEHGLVRRLENVLLNLPVPGDDAVYYATLKEPDDAAE